MIPSSQEWQQANQRYMQQHLRRIQSMLRLQASDHLDNDESINALPVMEYSEPAALDNLVDWFHLTPFERDVLLLCAGIELDGVFASLCAARQGEAMLPLPTFSLALGLFPSAHWSAVLPRGALRFWNLLELEPGRTLTTSPLRIDERILHYLAGISYLDARLAPFFEPLPAVFSPVPSYQRIAQEISAIWMQARLHDQDWPVIQLNGTDISAHQAIALVAARYVRCPIYTLALDSLPAQASERAFLIHLWRREILLQEPVLFLDCHGQDQSQTLDAALRRMIDTCQCPMLLSGYSAQGLRVALSFDIARPTVMEQEQLWHMHLGDHAELIEDQLALLTAHFHLTQAELEAIATRVQGHLKSRSLQEPVTSQALLEIIWELCCAQARPRLDRLAQRIEPVTEWDDLILPEAQRSILHMIAVHMRQRVQVYETWGFKEKGERGLGLTALFAGPSGVGKTTAAEALARDLHLDLYRVDLSSVISKYIGETEKNLGQIFDVAESSRVILLFDEADALFGKRSEVKDSHDRYANIEVSYLLQRMEAYQGLAILTTNKKEALDTAFLRRIRFVIQFPFPDAEQRADIWRHVFPAATPVDHLDVTRLARLNVTGGTIRNIALQAAFLAADALEPVQMKHLLQAAKHEYIKLERPFPLSETRDWLVPAEDVANGENVYLR